MDHDEIKNELKASLQKEVHIMRDVLANLHQEELSLMMRDQSCWNQLMQERAVMLERLDTWRNMRIQATKKLMEASGRKNLIHEFPVEELFSKEDDSACEILSLRDQLLALIQRMNLQNSHNQNLQTHLKNHPDLPLSCPWKPAPAPAKKRKSFIATQDP